jgi:autotransporter strand-loop-strand O-heptosyltransferase
MQKTCSDILGLDYKEIVPKIKMNKDVKKEKMVSIAIHGTAQTKYWNNPEGWQKLVDHLKSIGYKVVLVSKENDGYMGNSHPTGIEKLPAGEIEGVMDVIQRSEMFIGIGSGLSWLSWALAVSYTHLTLPTNVP